MKPNLLAAVLTIGSLSTSAGLHAQGTQPAAQVTSPPMSVEKAQTGNRVTLDMSKRPAQAHQLKAVAPKPAAAPPAAKKAKK